MSKKRNLLAVFLGLTALCATGIALGAGAIEGEAVKRPVNVAAIVMFLIFVTGTLGITYWAARRTRTASDFYTAGGGITGFSERLGHFR